jgi:predicted Ser/Thr protein kinase
MPLLEIDLRQYNVSKQSKQLSYYRQTVFHFFLFLKRTSANTFRISSIMTPSQIQLLQACVDEETESEFRILVNNKYIKYMTIDHGLYNVEDMCFGPSLIELLPPFPPGDWNEGHVTRDTETGTIGFTALKLSNLPGIERSWHSEKIEYLELKMGVKLRTNVHEATCDRFTSPVIAKFARFEWEIPQLDRETAAYEWIVGHHIGPQFLGHVLEEGRIIGFVMEHISGARHATPEDLPLCRAVLSNLHQLGIKHGDINKHNFLIHGGTATLIDFDSTSRPTDAGDLESELENLREQLEDTSGRGGSSTYIETPTGVDQ